MSLKTLNEMRHLSGLRPGNVGAGTGRDAPEDLTASKGTPAPQHREVIPSTQPGEVRGGGGKRSAGGPNAPTGPAAASQATADQGGDRAMRITEPVQDGGEVGAQTGRRTPEVVEALTYVRELLDLDPDLELEEDFDEDDLDENCECVDAGDCGCGEG